MPLYEYKCQLCGSIFEVIEKFSDEPLKTHASCGGAVERLLSLSALQFKGTGWYITDYARAGRNQHDAEAKPPKEGAVTPPAKTGSKPSASTADK